MSIQTTLDAFEALINGDRLNRRHFGTPTRTTPAQRVWQEVMSDRADELRERIARLREVTFDPAALGTFFEGEVFAGWKADLDVEGSLVAAEIVFGRPWETQDGQVEEEWETILRALVRVVDEAGSMAGDLASLLGHMDRDERHVRRQDLIQAGRDHARPDALLVGTAARAHGLSLDEAVERARRAAFKRVGRRIYLAVHRGLLLIEQSLEG